MKQDRSKTIIQSGWLFIAVNFLLAIFNVGIGILSNSLAIMSDAMHSLTDSVTGVLVILSEKLASHHKLSDYRVKIERTTTIIIASIIILLGAELVVSSIKNIITPEEVDYSTEVIVILVVSIMAKFLLARYLKNTGKNIKSDVLVASGAETMNDTWISVAVLVSAVIYLIWHINIESYISIVIALIIIKVGLEFIFPHLSHHHHHHLEQDPDHDHCQHTKK